MSEKKIDSSSWISETSLQQMMKYSELFESLMEDVGGMSDVVRDDLQKQVSDMVEIMETSEMTPRLFKRLDDQFRELTRKHNLILDLEG